MSSRPRPEPDSQPLRRRGPRARWMASALLAGILLPLSLWASLPVISHGAPPSQGSLVTLQSKIERLRERVGRKLGTERALSGDVARWSQKIGRLQGSISATQARQARLQARLDARRAELLEVQAELRRQRMRLARLRARLLEAREALATRLIEIYKAGRPDTVTVLLSADGFADLLERADFMSRVSAQDARIIRAVRTGKADATAAARRLDRLEARQQRVMAEIMERRDEVREVKRALIGRRVGYDRTRGGKVRALASVNAERRELEGHLRAIEAEQASVLAKLNAAQQGNVGLFAGPIRQGSGSLIWPVNGGVSSGFGPRWGRLHAGVDIPAPEGTPIRAADSGTVVIAGWMGGYGNYTCIQHSASMVTCNGHQVRLGTSVGANVSQGQVIGYVGNTGHSFGAHLHFEVRINGSPVDPMGYL